VGVLASLMEQQLQPSLNILEAQSYADLLKSIPNALEVLKAADSETESG
jgi:hypothetical protein